MAHKYAPRTLGSLYEESLSTLLKNSQEGSNDLSNHLVTIHREPTSVKNGRGISIPCGFVVRTRFGPRKTDGFFIASSDTIEILLEDGKVIECTPGHKLHTAEDWVESDSLRIGDQVLTDGGVSRVVGLRPNPRKTLVMDVCVPGPHEYFANGIVSHNSILANQLNINQASLGYRTNMVPLEMSSQEMISRTMSSVSGMDSIDIVLHRLATGERDLVWKRMKRFNRRIEQAGGKYTIFKPRSDMSMEEIMSAMHSLNADVNYIDYISLLKGVGGDDAWQKLGEVARFGKIYAEMHNRVVVLMAQVSEEGKVRYSQAIKEHASLGWVFVASKESKEKGFINIQTIKSRNQVAKDFTLKIEYKQTRVTDLDPKELEELEKERDQRNSAKSKRTRQDASEQQTDEDLPEL